VPKQATDPIYFIEIQFQKDPKIYGRLFAEIFLYLNHDPQQIWRAVLIFPNRNLQPEESFYQPYAALLTSEMVTVIFLDELPTTDSLGVNTLKLILEPEQSAKTQAQKLLQQTRATTLTPAQEQAIIDLIQTIIFYKIPTLSYQEVIDMLGLAESIKDIKVYQEGREEGRQEGKLMAVLPMVKAGISLEEIAASLELDLETIAKFIEANKNN
jgi:predicted transposase/invertase (TIGR01784 family)